MSYVLFQEVVSVLYFPFSFKKSSICVGVILNIENNHHTGLLCCGQLTEFSSVLERA